MRIAGIAAIALSAALPAPAAAEDGWEFNVMPYVWASGIDGSLSHAGLPRDFEVEAKFKDILENLDFGAMMAFEGHKGRVGFLLDGMYIKLSRDATVPQIGLPVELGSTTFTGMAAGQYRIVDDSIGSLDLLAGIRYWSVKSRFSYEVPVGTPLPPPLPPAYSASESANWVDGMVGAKMVVHVLPRVTLNAHGMVGTGGSRLTSDALLAVGFGLGQSTSVLLGYRHIKADYSKGNFNFDASLQGPALGLGFRF